MCVWMCVCVKEGDLSTKTETKTASLPAQSSRRVSFVFVYLFLIILRYIIRLSSTVSDFILFRFVFFYSARILKVIYISVLGFASRALNVCVFLCVVLLVLLCI